MPAAAVWRLSWFFSAPMAALMSFRWLSVVAHKPSGQHEAGHWSFTVAKGARIVIDVQSWKTRTVSNIGYLIVFQNA